MNKHYLRIDVNENPGTVTINGNTDGLIYLKKVIEDLLERPSSSLPDDNMLMLEDWGGKGLTNDKTAEGDTLAGILKIYRWE